MVMTIPEDLAKKLAEIADQENRSPEEVLRSLLNRYEPVPAAKTGQTE